jgi:hypothetical protein
VFSGKKIKKKFLPPFFRPLPVRRYDPVINLIFRGFSSIQTATLECRIQGNVVKLKKSDDILIIYQECTQNTVLFKNTSIFVAGFQDKSGN